MPSAALAAAVCLVAVTVVLLGPAAGRLSQARWVERSPRTALVLWQTLLAAAFSCLVAALLTLAVAPLASPVPHGLHVFTRQVLAGEPLRDLGGVQLACLAGAIAVVGWSASITACAFVRQARRRRGHRRQVDLLATRNEDGVHLIDHAVPAAYCLPGLRPRIVITSGLVGLLDTRELAAVIDHERAHARGRHHLLLLPFSALASALPHLPAARAAHTGAARLVEMLADDAARERHGGAAVARALVRVAEGRAQAGPLPTSVLGAAEGALTARVRRLTRQASPIAPWQRALVYGAALALPAGPLAVLIPCMT
ncbi:M56 family metallopeptidase [Actinocorallia populi]|uniref:M56 family metallopeptidase n=1 Tax=Actinocorallia populi TaxID=2079200 RepID=UPI000D08B284|nr:M56 family metallopeptidase [Actinocorallia populi]